MTTYRNSQGTRRWCDNCWRYFPDDQLTPTGEVDKFTDRPKAECKKCLTIHPAERPWMDPSVNRLYQSEREAMASGIFKDGTWATSGQHEKLSRDFENRLGPKPKHLEYEGVQAFVDRVQRSRWWKANMRTPGGRVQVVTLKTTFRTKSNSWSWGGNGSISMSHHHYNRWVVLHEMAHAVMPDANRAGHGRDYAHVYVKLVERFIGRAEADLLRNALRRRGMKWSARRTLSPEARQAAAERLRRVREAARP